MKITQYVSSAIKTIALSVGLIIALFSVGAFARNSTRPNLVSSIVKVTNISGDSGGTGFVTASEGKSVIVTNDHVCEVEQGGMVRIEDDAGRPYMKNILKRSGTRDLCVIEGIDAPILNLAKRAPVRFERIQIVGHPLLKPTAPSHGVVTGKMLATFLSQANADGSCNAGEEKVQVETLFGALSACTKTEELGTTTAPISPGNSGSPVFNLEGEIVGVVNSAGADSAAMFVPLNYLRDILGE